MWERTAVWEEGEEQEQKQNTRWTSPCGIALSQEKNVKTTEPQDWSKVYSGSYSHRWLEHPGKKLVFQLSALNSTPALFNFSPFKQGQCSLARQKNKTKNAYRPPVFVLLGLYRI